MEKLIAAARKSPADDRVPYGFQKRVMARLKTQKPLDFWALWSGALWKAAAPCVAITLLLSAWAWFNPAHSTSDLSQDFENTLLAATDQDNSTEVLR